MMEGPTLREIDTGPLVLIALFAALAAGIAAGRIITIHQAKAELDEGVTDAGG